MNKLIYLCALVALAGACNNQGNNRQSKGSTSDTSAKDSEYGAHITLAQQGPSINKFAKVLGWQTDKSPKAKKGFKVVRFADSLNSPRNIYVAPNGDIFVSQARTEKAGEDDEKIDSRNKFRDKSPNTILRFRDTDKDGVADSKEVFLSDLSQPYGMLVLGNHFYVANTDGLVRYPYDNNTGKVAPTVQPLLGLPAGGYNNHWTRNIIANKEGTKIYISVGSESNVGENGMGKEMRRAAILECDPDGGNSCIYASGLRNPVGIDFHPRTHKLWTVVNERDELGDELVPDYLTTVRKDGFYGWPYTYWGDNIDPRWHGKVPDSLNYKALTPDYALGAHTASLGLAFSRSNAFGDGVYIGQHGSWNRSELVGYKVVFIPFKDGAPAGPPEDFLTGFIANEANGEVFGRPVAVAFTDRYLLVTDDAANVIWAIIPE